MPVFTYVTLTVLTVSKECFLMSKNSTNEAEADYYLGCDVAQAKLDVSLVESRSGRELRHSIVANATEAIGSLLEGCLAEYSGSLQCVVEATGTYHFNRHSVPITAAPRCLPWPRRCS